MKKFLLTAWIPVMFMLSHTSAQDQLENPGFEAWDDVLIGASDTIREPVDWSSLKTSDDESLSPLAPVVCERSADAHSGNYSVQLTNVMTLLVANGTATNGRIHPNLITSLAYMYTDTADGRWNTPFTSRPDSITGWYKYSPQPSDTLEVQVILHKGYGKQPDNNYLNNWIAQAHFRSGINTGNQWHRFSTPFIYYNDQIPEYVLIILNSGNGFYPVAGSIAWFDDLNMVYGSGTATVKDSEEAPEFVYVEGNQTMVIRSCQPGRYTMAGIMDITGRVVWKEYITSDRIDISRAGLKKGLYLIILTGRNAHHTEKVLLN